MVDQLKLKTFKKFGFGNRIYEVLKDFKFNDQIILKGLVTDGGSIPKISILATCFILVWWQGWVFLLLPCYAIAIDESSGWLQKPFFLHDQDWQHANGWYHFFQANFQFFKNMLYKVVEVIKDDSLVWYRKIHDVFFGLVLVIMYPVAVSTFGAVVFYRKYLRSK